MSFNRFLIVKMKFVDSSIGERAWSPLQWSLPHSLLSLIHIQWKIVRQMILSNVQTRHDSRSPDGDCRYIRWLIIRDLIGDRRGVGLVGVLGSSQNSQVRAQMNIFRRKTFSTTLFVAIHWKMRQFGAEGQERKLWQSLYSTRMSWNGHNWEIIETKYLDRVILQPGLAQALDCGGLVVGKM